MHAKIDLRISVTGSESFGTIERAFTKHHLPMAADNTLYMVSEFDEVIVPEIERMITQLRTELTAAYSQPKGAPSE